MDERDPVDTVAPWTIKAVATATRELVTAAARREALTVGQWLERRVNEWEAAGRPVPVDGPAAATTGMGGDLAALAEFMREARALGEAAGVPVPPQLAKDAFATVKQALRQTRGLPPPRRKPQSLIEAE